MLDFLRKKNQHNRNILYDKNSLAQMIYKNLTEKNHDNHLCSGSSKNFVKIKV